ncbi:hypothetical protein NIES2101_43145 [Calothrix sp. HK-06]|nr:hypothetical protein NIES2101_43145 [Calothrix sp. HK-06]
MRVRVSRRKTFQDTAIPELIKVLDISGCIVTIDAIGCQKEIVKTITKQEGDFGVNFAPY